MKTSALTKASGVLQSCSASMDRVAGYGLRGARFRLRGCGVRAG